MIRHSVAGGELFENHVVGETVKSYRNTGREPYQCHCRDRDMKEWVLCAGRSSELRAWTR